MTSRLNLRTGKRFQDVSGVFAIIVLSAGAAISNSGDTMTDRDVVAHVIDMADSDEDGALSPEEYAEAALQSYGVSFEECDANGDAAVTEREYRDLYKAHHAGLEDGIEI
ncbi:MAG: hypothetical protein AB8G23_06065 [Myxococcota bacterium]